MRDPARRRWISLTNSCRVLALRLCGVEVGARVFVGRNVECNLGGIQDRTRGRIRLGPKSRLMSGVQLHCHGGSIELGHHVFLGQYTVVYGHGGVVIGDNVLVGMHTSIVAANHVVPPRGRAIRLEGDEPLPIRIGRDVWIGAGVCILGGVTIGEGSVVGAGAVVTKDLPPFSVAAGVPARVIKMRPEAPAAHA